MNKELLYKIAKKLPKPIRKLGKIFYNPIIPETLKLDYGQRLMDEKNERFMVDKLKSVLLNNTPGEIIEFGVYRGGSIISLAKCLKELKIKNKVVYGLDTFEGLPKSSTNDKVPNYYKGAMVENNLDKVKNILIENKVDDVTFLIKGLFQDTLKNLKDKKFCFAYVDCDLYEGTKQALEFLLPRTSKGGIIFIDDFYSSNWVGVKKAVLEFIHEKDLNEYNGLIYYIKN